MKRTERDAARAALPPFIAPGLPEHEVIEKALTEALALWQEQRSLYVFCMGGRSRSPSFVAGLIALAGYIGNYHQCFEHVRALHPSTGAMPEPRGTIERVVTRMLAASAAKT